jgi:hypothetical protein
VQIRFKIIQYYLFERNEVAVPRLRQLVAGLVKVRPGFIPRLIHVGFVLGGKGDLVTPFPPHIHPRTKTNPVS